MVLGETCRHTRRGAQHEHGLQHVSELREQRELLPVAGLPHVRLIELRQAPLFRTRITTCCCPLSQSITESELSTWLAQVERMMASLAWPVLPH